MTIATAASTSIKVVLPYQTANSYTTWAQVDNTNGQILIGSGSVVKKDMGAATPSETNLVVTDVVATATTASTANWIGAAPTTGYYNSNGTFNLGTAKW